MSVIPPEGLTRRIFGPGTGPDGSGRPVRFIWTNFQAKPPVLDPFGTKFDAFGASHNFGGDLTSPVLLCTIPAGAFSRRKWPPLDLTSPVAANQLAAGAFFQVKMATQDLTSPVAANQLAAGAFFSVKMATQDFTSFVAALQLAAGAFFQ